MAKSSETEWDSNWKPEGIPGTAPYQGTSEWDAIGQKDVPKARALPIEWFADIAPSLEGRWAIKRLIPATGLVLVYGHPGSGKSFLALDMSMHVALGWEWHGRITKQGAVVYVGAEGQGGLRLRIEAFRRTHDVANMPFALVPTQLDLLDPQADLNLLVSGITQQLRSQSHTSVSLIVIDTLSRTFGGGDENTADMTAYLANIGKLQETFGCAIMLVHHRPKNSENETPRGHGSLWGACDTIILVEAGDVKTARITKQKDADAGDPISFKLRQIELGTDEDGDPVNSCVVEASEQAMTKRGGKKLTAYETIALRELDRLLIEKGQYPPKSIPDNVLDRARTAKVVDLSEWRSATLSALHDPDKKADTARTNFDRARKSLQAAEIVGLWEDSAWHIL